ncbi:ribbon-helix-helix domain-containing protein [Ensifer sp. PDNC004]|uniref:ribbon-helix-helix domain-containing protein n=1 Tax=Ensifer sp. PDNC004 TaxID=2811423 RepID=UPI001963855D|nr:ribbon-helix-helix domain-containing protein [Ensifer sp. PDNC004]QRY68400.1 ribbon-helix-helix domain-containing protein [Ensifer sp. PDNC004]
MIRKHSATLHGHRTSFSLEDAFWQELKTIAAKRAMPLAQLIAEIDDQRTPDSNLSSALRVYVLEWLKSITPRARRAIARRRARTMPL